MSRERTIEIHYTVCTQPPGTCGQQQADDAIACNRRGDSGPSVSCVRPHLGDVAVIVDARALVMMSPMYEPIHDTEQAHDPKSNAQIV